MLSRLRSTHGWSFATGSTAVGIFEAIIALMGGVSKNDNDFYAPHGTPIIPQDK